MLPCHQAKHLLNLLIRLSDSDKNVINQVTQAISWRGI
jgi:hypothetical protein